MRAIIFAAVSTQEQATNDHASIETQLDDSRAACEHHGWDVVAEIAVRGHSRNYEFLHRLMADCPEYAEMVGLVESHAVDLVVCRSWDRLARTTNLQHDVARLFDKHAVQVFALNSPQIPVKRSELDDQVRHTRKISRFVLGWTAEQENIERKARQRAGMRARIRRGLHGSASKTPYGYRYGGSAETPLQVVPQEASWVRWIFEQRADLKGCTTIANALTERGVPTKTGVGAWHGYTVRRILANDYYIGVVSWGRYQSPDGLHEPIIDKELWDTVQRVNAKRRHKDTGIHALTSLCKCGLCGYAMEHCSGGDYLYLRCGKHAKYRTCTSNYFRADKVEAYVLEKVEAFLSNPSLYRDYAENQHDDDPDKLSRIESRLKRLATQRDRLLHQYLRGNVNDQTYEREIDRIKRQEIAAQADRRELREWQERVDDIEANMLKLRTVNVALENASPDERNRVYHMLIEKVVLVEDSPPEIHWYL